MNASRGFFRLWLILTVAWVGVIFAASGRYERTEAVWEFMLGPPIVLGAIFKALAWIAQGLRAKDY